MVKVKRKHNYDLKLNKRINLENLVPQKTNLFKSTLDGKYAKSCPLTSKFS
jgi:hypothetical protein